MIHGHRSTLLLVPLLLAGLHTSVQADVKLASIFGNSMVLQREPARAPMREPGPEPMRAE